MSISGRGRLKVFGNCCTKKVGERPAWSEKARDKHEVPELFNVEVRSVGEMKERTILFLLEEW